MDDSAAMRSEAEEDEEVVLVVVEIVPEDTSNTGGTQAVDMKTQCRRRSRGLSKDSRRRLSKDVRSVGSEGWEGHSLVFERKSGER